MLKRLAAAGVVTAAMGGVLLSASPAMAGDDFPWYGKIGYGTVIDNDNTNINRSNSESDADADANATVPEEEAGA